MEQFDFFVAEEELVIGFFILNVDGAELNALYLDPAAAGRGVGRQLLEYAERLARRKSVTHLKVVSTLNAVGFYEVCGYRRLDNSIHTNPFGLELACVEMHRKL
jgi:GNAT superfamily N-acetyltransferase